MRWIQDKGIPANINPELKGSARLSLPAAAKLFAQGSVSIANVNLDMPILTYEFAFFGETFAN